MGQIKNIRDFEEKAHKFYELVKNEKTVYIQMHNFPDHDAIASALGLQHLLNNFDIESHIIYDGIVTRSDLKKMILKLGINIHHYREFDIKPEDKIVVIDGNTSNKNVSPLEGNQFAVIDHHEVTGDVGAEFTDIRPNIGSSSTIVFFYLAVLGIPVSSKLATAFIVGLLIDTNKMTRSVSVYDLDAYYDLYFKSDVEICNSIVRNCITIADLSFYKAAITNLRTEKFFGLCYFPEKCNPGLLGIIGDFLLSVEEISFIVLCAKNDGVINLSARNEMSKWNAAFILHDVLKGMGFGGGHADLAGGYIESTEDFDEDMLFRKFTKYLFQ